ncbi:MAG: T9SS type A sorting domain-containing protein [Tannerella sp.]|jgi:hypothetical protein|nr:T9SS type A sorting domain-containing protein [Tannerella sp.]
MKTSFGTILQPNNQGGELFYLDKIDSTRYLIKYGDRYIVPVPATLTPGIDFRYSQNFTAVLAIRYGDNLEYIVGGDLITRDALTVTIQPNGEVGNGIVDGAPHVWSYGNSIYIRTSEAQTVTVYTLTGAIVKQQILPQGTTVINHIERGVYIVKLGNRTWKVVIR